jgi:hypothetical protein
VRGVEADLDRSFSDVWDTLDSAFMGMFTAQKGPWSFGLETVYFKLEDQGFTQAANAVGLPSTERTLPPQGWLLLTALIHLETECSRLPNKSNASMHVD